VENEGERKDMFGLNVPAARAFADRQGLRYGIAAILIGILFVGVTGFAPIEAIHDAAHNTRHSISLPCH
jgi:cobalt transporter subunit CbtB